MTRKSNTMVTTVQFATRFKVGVGAVSSMIRDGRLRAVNIAKEPGARANWRVPYTEVERFIAAGYFPRKKMPVVTGDAEPVASQNGTTEAAPQQNIDQQIEFHASNLARLIDEKLGRLADLSELATQARKLLK